MKKQFITIAALALVGSMALAADTENKAESSTDTSKNPITGSETTTKKSTKKMKHGHAKSESTTKESATKHKDGAVDTKTTTETTTETK